MIESPSSRRKFLGVVPPTVGVRGLEPTLSPARASTPAGAGRMIGRAVGSLRSRPDKDGAWPAGRKQPCVDALIATALHRPGRVTADEPGVGMALSHPERLIGPESGLGRASHAIYAASIVLTAFRCELR